MSLIFPKFTRFLNTDATLHMHHPSSPKHPLQPPHNKESKKNDSKDNLQIFVSNNYRLDDSFTWMAV